ncbi:MAG: hypothetical protein OXE43_14495 [Chloroflexi bacterium]|nr:hypothetical protein [Chloroflexota bacterium]
MKQAKLWGIALLVGAFVLGFTFGVDAQNSPARFRGTVTVNGEPADVGSSVVAIVNGVGCGSATVFWGATSPSYMLDVPPSCASGGDSISFAVNGQAADQTGTWRSGGSSNLDLTVRTSQGDARAKAGVEVTVWRRVRDPSLLYVSTRPEGGRWRTLDTALDMSRRSDSGRFHQSNAVGVGVPLEAGTALVEVTVWRRISDPSLLYVSTRPEGGHWRTLNAALDMSRLSDSGRFHQSNAVSVEVPLPEPVAAPTPAAVSKPFMGEGCTGDPFYDGGAWCSGISYSADRNSFDEFVTIVSTDSGAGSFYFGCYEIGGGRLAVTVSDSSISSATRPSEVSRVVEYSVDSGAFIRELWDQGALASRLWAPDPVGILDRLEGAAVLVVRALGQEHRFDVAGMTSTPAKYNIDNCSVVSVGEGFAACHPSYEPCLPHFPDDAFDCSDFEAHQRPVHVVVLGVDPYQLDDDGDGWACELPRGR